MTHSDQRAYFFKIDTTIKRIRGFMQKGLSDANIDLTVDQWVILDHIQPMPGISQNDLANATAKDAPTTTRILELLLQKGLIQRKMNETDRRKFHVSLTPEGEKVHSHAFRVIAQVRKQAWKNLNAADYQQLVRIMDQMYSNVSEK